MIPTPTLVLCDNLVSIKILDQCFLIINKSGADERAGGVTDYWICATSHGWYWPRATTASATTVTSTRYLYTIALANSALPLNTDNTFNLTTPLLLSWGHLRG